MAWLWWDTVCLEDMFWRCDGDGEISSNLPDLPKMMSLRKDCGCPLCWCWLSVKPLPWTSGGVWVLVMFCQRLGSMVRKWVWKNLLLNQKKNMIYLSCYQIYQIPTGYPWAPLLTDSSNSLIGFEYGWRFVCLEEYLTNSTFGCGSKLHCAFWTWTNANVT